MRILYLNHNIKGEGTFFRAFNFAKPLARLGHEVTILTLSPSNNFKHAKYVESGVTIVETPKFLDHDRGGWAWLDTAYRKLFAMVERFDLVHAFDHKPNVYFPALINRAFHKGTLLFSDWADWWSKGGINSRLTPTSIVESFLEDDIRKRADAVTVTSLALEERALELGIDMNRVFYIPSGCDTGRIRPRHPLEIKKLKEKYGIKPGADVIEFIGFGQADLGILLDGYVEARKKRPSLVFIIVGPLEPRWKQKVASMPERDGLMITGKVPFGAVADYAAIADIFLMPLSDNPANRGRGPIKAGDYMAAGRPIIANPVGDIRTWIRKYRIGELADYDGHSVAKCVLKLLGHKGLMKEYGRNARKAAETVLSWDLAAENMEEAYNTIKNSKLKIQN